MTLPYVIILKAGAASCPQFFHRTGSRTGFIALRSAWSPQVHWRWKRTIRFKRPGGIAVDESYRPLYTGPLSNRLYCVAIPFRLHKHPFVQGITNAAELGETAARPYWKTSAKPSCRRYF